jgi:hypothetical protein
MISFSEEDLEVKLAYKDYNSLPQRIMMKRWEECDRDVFKFWDSIEWDSTWLRHDTDEEKYAKDVTREFNRHPFKKFISKPKEYLEVI